jgi:hypothetical protein
MVKELQKELHSMKKSRYKLFMELFYTKKKGSTRLTDSILYERAQNMK